MATQAVWIVADGVKRHIIKDLISDTTEFRENTVIGIQSSRNLEVELDHSYTHLLLVNCKEGIDSKFRLSLVDFIAQKNGMYLNISYIVYIYYCHYSFE